MGIVDGLYSRGIAQQIVWLSGLLPYQYCVEVLGRIGQLQVSLSSIWRCGQHYGEELLKVAQHQQSQVSPERVQIAPALAAHEEVKGVSLDGGMVNIRDEGWKEMKVGAVYNVTLKLEHDERTGEYAQFSHAQDLAYIAVLGDVEALAPGLLSLSC